MRQEIINDIKKEYQKKRLRSKAELQMRRTELYEMLPEIKTIDNTISKLSLEVSRLAFTRPANFEKKMEDCRVTINELREEKKSILEKRKIPDIYLKEVHSCSKCSDTGYVDGKMCSCYKQLLINELYNISGLGQLLEKENFDTFDLSKFDDAKYGNEKMSQRENMKQVFRAALHYTDNFHKSNKNLLFYGGTGLGKTFTCNCIAKELMGKGIVVLYQTAFRMFETISEHKFNRSAESYENKDNYSMIYNADLLIIDDLGSESINSFTNTELFNILNSRMINNKKTIVSTNLSLEKMSEIYSDRIISRIMSTYGMIKFFGKDIRTR
ncbi:DNA replication protein DnaC [Dethiosulfatibacter aminovorans DSM 17477]|uniref:DNA replication protein DnaC n=1 Tax=Dethiosulfatibacter aminovorans DSM 17477 TaxID=1121476 RepID=A0A1M6HZH9_9FIRM|nr:ATP-binding protein [Dethiosulfatibacter aminovorans]SHJ27626.1 DNA replication protein DnaC [Dethiosulfatibacter aminovorans DSM 17477]